MVMEASGSCNFNFLNTEQKSADEIVNEERPPKLKRQDAAIFDFAALFGETKESHSIILSHYMKHLEEKRGMKGAIAYNPPKQPDFVVGILSGQPDTIIEIDGKRFPVLFKPISVGQKSHNLPIAQIIAKSSDGWMIERDFGRWMVVPETPLYYMCQNCLAISKSETMLLIIYDRSNLQFLEVEVRFDQKSFARNLKKLYFFIVTAYADTRIC